MAVGGIVLRHHQNSAGILVQPMYNAWSQRPPQISQVVTMMEETVYKGGFSVAGSRMNHQTRGFVDPDQMLVFKNYLQGERFRR